jgi:hypothetical protein
VISCPEIRLRATILCDLSYGFEMPKQAHFEGNAVRKQLWKIQQRIQFNFTDVDFAADLQMEY